MKRPPRSFDCGFVSPSSISGSISVSISISSVGRLGVASRQLFLVQQDPIALCNSVCCFVPFLFNHLLQTTLFFPVSILISCAAGRTDISYTRMDIFIYIASS